MFETGDKSYEYHKMLKIAIILHHQKVVNKTTTKGDHKALTFKIKQGAKWKKGRGEICMFNSERHTEKNSGGA